MCSSGPATQFIEAQCKVKMEDPCSKDTENFNTITVGHDTKCKSLLSPGPYSITLTHTFGAIPGPAQTFQVYSFMIGDPIHFCLIRKLTLTITPASLSPHFPFLLTSHFLKSLPTSHQQRPSFNHNSSTCCLVFYPLKCIIFAVSILNEN